MQIYRSAHTIKGNASLLDLDFLVDTAHSLEEKLQELKNKDILANEDFLALFVGFEALQKSIVSMNESVQKLLQFKNNISSHENVNSIIIKALEKLIERNVEENRTIKIETNNFDLSMLNVKNRVLIKDILIQLARNSIAHGIEPHQERQEKNKNIFGTIFLETNFKNGIFELIYKDDGRGINITRLREKAIEQKIISQEQAENLSVQESAELIFASGLSSASQTTIMAGRGVGMDLVREKLNKIEGSINVEFEANKFTKFTIRF